MVVHAFWHMHDAAFSSLYTAASDEGTECMYSLPGGAQSCRYDMTANCLSHRFAWGQKRMQHNVDASLQIQNKLPDFILFSVSRQQTIGMQSDQHRMHFFKM